MNDAYTEKELVELEKEVKGHLGFFNRHIILRLIRTIWRFQHELDLLAKKRWFTQYR